MHITLFASSQDFLHTHTHTYPHIMASSVSKLLASVDKFDETNWDDWSYSIRSAFRLSHILRIVEGKETCPTAAIPLAPY